MRPSRDPTTVAGLVIALRTMKSKRGETIAFVTLDDQSGRVELSVSGALFELNRDKLQKDSILVVKGTVSVDDFSGGMRMRASDVWNLVQARENNAKNLMVKLDSCQLQNDFSSHLARLLEPYRGAEGCKVSIMYSRENAKARVLLGDNWRVRPHDDLIDKLREHYGAGRVEIEY